MCFDISEFSYDTWVRGYCPIGMPEGEWFANYYREFNTCGVNSTFSIPQPISLKAAAGMDFIFADNHWRRQAVGTTNQLRVMLD